MIQAQGRRSAYGVVEVAAEPDDGGKAEAGTNDARDDVGGLGRLVGIPVVGDGFGDAAELDDGEFGGEPALEDVDAAADLGDGHGIASDGSFYLDETARGGPQQVDGMDRIGYQDVLVGIFGKSRSFPLISIPLSRALGWDVGQMDAARAVLGAIFTVLAGIRAVFWERSWGFGVWMWGLGWQRDRFETRVNYGKDGRRVEAKGKCHWQRERAEREYPEEAKALRLRTANHRCEARFRKLVYVSRTPA